MRFKGGIFRHPDDFPFYALRCPVRKNISSLHEPLTFVIISDYHENHKFFLENKAFEFLLPIGAWKKPQIKCMLEIHNETFKI